MPYLKSILKYFFLTLGVIFFILILGSLYLWIADPFNLKGVLNEKASPMEVIPVLTGQREIQIDNIDKNPLLNEQQEAQLEALGVEVEELPTEVTPELEQCLQQELGAERLEAIIAGEQPTASDFLRGQSCF